MIVKIVNVSGKEDNKEEIEIDSISVGDLLKKLNIDFRSYSNKKW
ncbi:hypothetical protein [Methanobacterium sp.]